MQVAEPSPRPRLQPHRPNAEMLFTRPQLTPLRIDLAEIAGGGSCPAQFEGLTADGQGIFLRYRGSRLTVTRRGVDGSADFETLLDACIGPPLHGDMLLEQACDLAGLTVRGQRLELSDETRWRAADGANILDWSGRTTYWVKPVVTTERGERDFARALVRRFPDLCILDIDWSNHPKRRYLRRESVDRCEHGALLAFGGSAASLDRILTSGHVSERDLAGAFAQIVGFHVYRHRLRLNEVHQAAVPPPPSLQDRLSEEIGRPIVLADVMGGTLTTSVETGSQEGERLLSELGAIFEAHFTQNSEMVELRTSAASAVSFDRWYSRDLTEWCAAAPNHYIEAYWYFDDLNGPVGWRPRRTG